MDEQERENEKEVLDLIRKIRADGTDSDKALRELMDRYEPLVKSLSQKYSANIEGEKDDVRQEADLAFYKAVLRFDLDQGKVSFGLFAKICITNALRSYWRKKQAAKRLQAKSYTEGIYRDISAASDTAARVAEWEAYELLRESFSSHLSKYEDQVLHLYAERYTAEQIAQKTGRSRRSVENAIYRMRKKIRAAQGGTDRKN